MDILVKLKTKHTNKIKKSFKAQWSKVKEISSFDPHFDVIEKDLQDIELEISRIKETQKGLLDEIMAIDDCISELLETEEYRPLELDSLVNEFEVVLNSKLKINKNLLSILQ
ncbi:hypothetical protein HDV01_001915 [Terramyces sp. JEL0728]|nr:hypothetical protein HDV01_001915 [Terramyces sp. JEL0728]